MNFSRSFCFVILLFSALALAPACAPKSGAIGKDGVAVSGRGAFQVNVAPPLVLAGSGSFRTPVPADVSMPPNGDFRYAVYALGGSGPVTGQVHVLTSRVDSYNWRWEKETWALPESLYYSKQRAGGRNWTVQILPVVGERDWFSALWAANNRQTPEFWLAKRWSATPDDDIRIVAEYREQAPLCLEEPLAAIREQARNDKNAPGIRGKDLARACAREIEDFSRRADAALDFERGGLKVAADGQPDADAIPNTNDAPAGDLVRPSMRPDMGKLVGRAEKISRGGVYDQRN